MAHLYMRSEGQQQHWRPGFAPVCSFSPAFVLPQGWPQNVMCSRESDFQYREPFIQYPTPQGDVRPSFYVPHSFEFSLNQQQGMTNSMSSRHYVLQHSPNVNELIVRRIRDILIDILNSANCKYGVTVSELLLFLKHSCTNYNVVLPASITDSFNAFLRYEMTDYVEIEDDLCRYRRPTLSIQEENISSVCERASNCAKTSLAALVSCGEFQQYEIMSAVSTNGSFSTNQMEKVASKMEENVLNRSIEARLLSSTEFRDSKPKEDYKNTDAKKTHVAGPPVLTDDKKCKVLLRNVKKNALADYSYMKNDLAKVLKEWKQIFIGDLKELIRYLRMVDDYFQANDGKFVLSKFKEVFGELNKRWEFCDIDLIEMGILNVVPGNLLNEELVLIVNPIVREMEFPEVTQLATEIHNLLSRLLQAVSSVKIEVIVRTMNFGKTIDEKYALVWEVLSDSQFQDVFVVDVLQKQNKGCGFDVMIRLN